MCAVQDDDVNEVLQRSEGGVDSALLYAKTISKYMKDLITYVEKRTSLGGHTHGWQWSAGNRKVTGPIPGYS